MKRTDFPNIKLCGFFKKILNLNTVLTADIEVISSCLASPIVLLSVKCAKCAEAVRREKNLFCTFIWNHNLRPMNHGSHYECKLVRTEFKFVTLFDCNGFIRKIKIRKKLREHWKSLCITNKLHWRIFLGNNLNIWRMVGFKVADYKIIGSSAVKLSVKIFKPFVSFSLVNRIHNCNLFVNNKIWVVRNSVGNKILTFKKVDCLVINANVFYRIGNFNLHCILSFINLCPYLSEIFVKSIILCYQVEIKMIIILNTNHILNT